MLRAVLPKKSGYFSFAKITILSSAAIFVGCQRIPDQERVTKLSVADIVRNIRCEIRRSLVEKYDPETDEMVKLFPVPTFNQDDEMEDGHWIYRATVSYTFKFTTTIKNDLDLAFNGVWNIPRRVGRRAREKLTSNNSIDFDQQREGINDWVGSESLGNLLLTKCPSEDNRRYLKYPIKGKIGVDKVIDNFYNIAKTPFLTVTKYQKTLEFTVLKGGTLNPIYFISPVPLDRRTFDFPLTLALNRTDIHSVILDFKLPEEEQYRVDGTDKPKPPSGVTLVRIVGGKKKTEDGKEVEICEIDKDKKPIPKTCKVARFPSEISIVPTGGTVGGPVPAFAPIATGGDQPKKKFIYTVDGKKVDPETLKAAETVPATKAQGDSIGLSPSVRRRLEDQQATERLINSDALRRER